MGREEAGELLEVRRHGGGAVAAGGHHDRQHRARVRARAGAVRVAGGRTERALGVEQAQASLEVDRALADAVVLLARRGRRAARRRRGCVPGRTCRSAAGSPGMPGCRCRPGCPGGTAPCPGAPAAAAPRCWAGGGWVPCRRTCRGRGPRPGRGSGRAGCRPSARPAPGPAPRPPRRRCHPRPGGTPRRRSPRHTTFPPPRPRS